MSAASLRNGGGLVDAPGRGLVGAKGEYQRFVCPICQVKGLGPALQIAEGFSVDLPEKVHKTLNERTNPSWPTTWFVPNVTGSGPFRDVYTVMNNWSANHGSISYGHIGADLIALALLLRIPVAMHNVADEIVSARAPGASSAPRNRRPRITGRTRTSGRFTAERP